MVAKSKILCYNYTEQFLAHQLVLYCCTKMKFGGNNAGLQNSRP